MKTICCICGEHMKGSPADPKISHGMHDLCADLYNRAQFGEPIEIEFWNPGNGDKCIALLALLDAKFIRIQELQGRTERQVIQKGGKP